MFIRFDQSHVRPLVGSTETSWSRIAAWTDDARSSVEVVGTAPMRASHSARRRDPIMREAIGHVLMISSSSADTAKSAIDPDWPIPERKPHGHGVTLVLIWKRRAFNIEATKCQ
jgi:hypothetical protein